MMNKLTEVEIAFLTMVLLELKPESEQDVKEMINSILVKLIDHYKEKRDQYNA